MSDDIETPAEPTVQPPPDESPFALQPVDRRGRQDDPRFASIDPNESPFELHEISGLPLTREERAELREIIEEFDRERANAGGGVDTARPRGYRTRRLRALWPWRR